MSQMGAAQFKARCLQIMERVRRTREAVVITKRGMPVAKLVPADAPGKRAVLGCLRGAVEIVGDPTAPLFTHREWAEIERRNDEQWKRWHAGRAPRRGPRGRIGRRR